MRATLRMLSVAFLAATAEGLRLTSRRSALGFGTALLMPGQRALADSQGTPFGPYGERLTPLKQGEEARMSFSSEDNDAVSRNALTGGSGTQLYQANVVDPAKVEAVSVRWRNMVAGVRKALTNEKGTKAANAAAAKAAFDTGMGQLKVDMRAVAKALAGGDVTRRETETRGGGATADFNYNTGQFKLQPIAETPEAIYRIITDAYVNDLKSSPAAALDKMDKADALFEGWLAAVRASS